MWDNKKKKQGRETKASKPKSNTVSELIEKLINVCSISQKRSQRKTKDNGKESRDTNTSGH